MSPRGGAIGQQSRGTQARFECARVQLLAGNKTSKTSKTHAHTDIKCRGSRDWTAPHKVKFAAASPKGSYQLVAMSLNNLSLLVLELSRGASL